MSIFLSSRFHLAVLFDTNSSFYKIILLFVEVIKLFFGKRPDNKHFKSCSIQSMLELFYCSTKSFIIQTSYKNRWELEFRGREWMRGWLTHRLWFSWPCFLGIYIICSQFPSTFCYLFLFSPSACYFFYYVLHWDQLSSL